MSTQGLYLRGVPVLPPAPTPYAMPSTTPAVDWGTQPGITWLPPDAHRPGAGAAAPPSPFDVVHRGSIEDMSTGDYMGATLGEFKGGIALTAAMSGGLAAIAAPEGAKAMAFGGRALRSAGTSVVMLAAAGAVVGMTSPKDGDKLSTRYAVVLGGMGGLAGLTWPGGTKGKAIAAGVGAVLGALGGSSAGSHIQARAEAPRLQPG
ncbi:MAG: hypothetical protein JWM98_2194 [Thermoleophilia bacterium]|nr:hypothetical protein [Thermoleophilia bacterium]